MRRAARARRHVQLRAQRLRRRAALRPAHRHQQGAGRAEEGVRDDGGGSGRGDEPVRVHQQEPEAGREGLVRREDRRRAAQRPLPPQQAAADPVGPAVADALLLGERQVAREAGGALRAHVRARPRCRSRAGSLGAARARAAGQAARLRRLPPDALRAGPRGRRPVPRVSVGRQGPGAEGFPRQRVPPVALARGRRPHRHHRDGEGRRRHDLHRPESLDLDCAYGQTGKDVAPRRRPEPHARGARRAAQRQGPAQGRHDPRRRTACSSRSRSTPRRFAVGAREAAGRRGGRNAARAVRGAHRAAARPVQDARRAVRDVPGPRSSAWEAPSDLRRWILQTTQKPVARWRGGAWISAPTPVHAASGTSGSRPDHSARTGAETSKSAALRYADLDRRGRL